MPSVQLDDQLFQQAAEFAASQGKTVDEFIAVTLQHAVEKTVPRNLVLQQRIRNGLPVVFVENETLRIEPSKVREAIEEEGF